MTRSHSTSRRNVLRLLAAGGLLPFLASHARIARGAGTPATRLVLMMQSNGTSQSTFWPDAAGSSRILEPLLSDARLRERTTIVKGLFNHAGGAGNAHDQGFAGLYSGVRTAGTFDDPWGMAPSLDQSLRRALSFDVPFPTLAAGVLASDTRTVKDHRSSFVYLAPKRQVPTAVDPHALHAALFGAGAGPELAKKRLLEERSVLDYGARDLATLQSKLSGAQREALDVHASSVRDLERRLALLGARPTPTGVCRGPGAPREGLGQTEADVPELMDAMLQLGAVAVGCGLVQILTFQMGNGGEKWRFDWLDIHKNSHDDIAHLDDGRKPDITELLVRINRWYAERVAQLARTLDAMPSSGGEGTALDDTLIVWGNEQATGPHGLDDIPVVLIGGASGRLPRGFRVVDQGPQTYHRLGCSLTNIMGVPAEGFGEEPSCGPIRGL